MPRAGSWEREISDDQSVPRAMLGRDCTGHTLPLGPLEPWVTAGKSSGLAQGSNWKQETHSFELSDLWLGKLDSGKTEFDPLSSPKEDAETTKTQGASRVLCAFCFCLGRETKLGWQRLRSKGCFLDLNVPKRLLSGCTYHYLGYSFFENIHIPYG